MQLGPILQLSPVNHHDRNDALNKDFPDRDSAGVPAGLRGTGSPADSTGGMMDSCAKKTQDPHAQLLPVCHSAPEGLSGVFVSVRLKISGG